MEENRPADPHPPRSLALLDLAMKQLRLSALPPYQISLSLGVLAVAGGVLVPGLFGNLAGRLLAIQMVVITAIGFVVVALLLRRRPLAGPETRKTLARVVDVAMLVCVLASFVFGGVTGPLEFLALAGATVIGALRGEHDARELADVGVRCAVAGLILQVVAGLSGLGERIGDWPGAPGSVAAAGVYFGTLAVLERTPVYAYGARRVLEVVEIVRAASRGH